MSTYTYIYTSWGNTQHTPPMKLYTLYLYCTYPMPHHVYKYIFIYLPILRPIGSITPSEILAYKYEYV